MTEHEAWMTEHEKGIGKGLAQQRVLYHTTDQHTKQLADIRQDMAQLAAELAQSQAQIAELKGQQEGLAQAQGPAPRVEAGSSAASSVGGEFEDLKSPP